MEHSEVEGSVLTSDHPLTISVVIPTYNRAHVLERSVQSVLEQDYPASEVLIVDDGSTDETSSVVQKLAAKDARVRYLYQENSGACAARNLGWRKAKGDLVAFQDSDDEWSRDKLGKQLAIRREIGGAALISCRHSVYLDESGGPIIRPVLAEPVEIALLRDSCISTQTILVDKEVLTRMGGFDPSLERLQDWDLCLQILALGNVPVVILPEPLASVYRQFDSITSNGPAYYRSLEKIVRKHWLLLMKRPNSFAFILLRVGKRRLRNILEMLRR